MPEVTPPKYIRDDRSESYFRFGPIISTIARERYGLAIDELTEKRWSEIMGLLREYDTLLDDTDITPDEALTTLESFDIFSENYPSLRPGTLHDEVFDRLLGRVMTIIELGDAISHETNINRFICLRAGEATETTLMLRDAATDIVRQQPKFDGEFMPGLLCLAEAANVLDSIIDARQDYKEGKIELAPSREVLCTMSRRVFQLIQQEKQSLLSRQVSKQLFGIAFDRFKNRLRNGGVSYSSLNNFIPFSSLQPLHRSKKAS